MTNGNNIEVVWHSDKKKRKKNNKLYFIDKELVNVLLLEVMKKNITPGLGEEISIEGYTQATIITKNDNRVIFYAHLISSSI
jgi:predicted AAA+ superfamily ATPase